MKSQLVGPIHVAGTFGSFYLPDVKQLTFHKPTDERGRYFVVGPHHSCFYMTDGNLLECEIGRKDGIDAYWVNGHRVFKAVWERYYGEPT